VVYSGFIKIKSLSITVFGFAVKVTTWTKLKDVDVLINSTMYISAFRITPAVEF